MKLNFAFVVILVALVFNPHHADAWSFGSFFSSGWKVITDTVEIVADVIDVLPPEEGRNNCPPDTTIQREEANVLGFHGRRNLYACCDGYDRVSDDEKHCDIIICAGTSDCGNRGQCVSPNTCRCNSGYTGSTSGCRAIECLGSADCRDRGSCTGPSTCTCYDGYSGSNVGCSNDVNECASSNGGCQQLCVNTHGSFYCDCHNGYNVVGTQCENINECADGTHNCGHECTDTTPGFTCSCYSGYKTHDGGVSCLDIDECAVANKCQETCNNIGGGYYCSCPAGFYLVDEKDCLDQDECSNEAHNCQYSCNNNHGSFTCSCPSGYNLNSDMETCSDIDECTGSSNPCGIHSCENLDGTYSCTCATGFQSVTNQECSDINECSTGTSNCDHSCSNNIGSFSCSCDTGYVLDGNQYTCNDINECDGDNSCDVNADCENQAGSYTCVCKAGYEGTGQYCTPICSMTCLNGGTCSAPETCECISRFEGTDCSTPICENCVNGECVAGPEANICSCRAGYQGTSCDEDFNECLKSPCSHECVNTEGSYHCECPVGLMLDDTQLNCEDHNECETDTHGCEQCINILGSYACACDDGFELIPPDNKLCQDIDECTTGANNCEQICENTSGSYNCACMDGYRLLQDGHTCVDIDECLVENICDQFCINTNGSYSCACGDGYVLGDDQHTCLDVDECTKETDSCEHICTNTEGSYTCSCNEGYELSSNERGCEDVDECVGDNNCQQVCNNAIGSYTCGCDAGFVMEDDLISCSDVNECADDGTHDCHHVCANSVGSFDCSCDTGFYLAADGKTCRELVNAWTISKSGCQCYYDPTRNDCPCCIDGGCQCAEKEGNKCVQCGYGENCEIPLLQDAAPCFFLVADLKSTLGFKAKCDARGRFEPMQCDETGSCWCVDRLGKTVEGSVSKSKISNCENRNLVNGWTLKRTGCKCDFDPTRTDCACCVEGACSCGERSPHICTQCGMVDNCETIESRYPGELLDLLP